MVRYLPQAMVATACVVAWPTVAVWLLRSGSYVGALLDIVIGVVLSLAASTLGALYWKHLGRSQDVLFSDLMIWGWVRRWRAEHRLAAVMAALGSATAADWDAVTACIRTLSTGEDEAGVDWMAQSRVRLLAQLAQALEAGDPYTRGHSLRVARYASMIAERMGLASAEVERIRLAGALHDIGKVNTPVAILHKPGQLTNEEYAVVQRHPVDGARLVEALDDPLLTAIVRHHHERLDGGGYPDRLAGDRIPLGARIMAVADTFDAITSARPYRAAAKHTRALTVMEGEAGRQLDAEAVAAFRDCYADRRSLTKWAALSSLPSRALSWLGSANPAAAMTVSKAITAASAVAVVGTASAAVPRLSLTAPSAPAPPALRAATQPASQPGDAHGHSAAAGIRVAEASMQGGRRPLALPTLALRTTRPPRPRPTWRARASRRHASTSSRQPITIASASPSSAPVVTQAPAADPGQAPTATATTTPRGGSATGTSRSAGATSAAHGSSSSAHGSSSSTHGSSSASSTGGSTSHGSGSGAAGSDAGGQGSGSSATHSGSSSDGGGTAPPGGAAGGTGGASTGAGGMNTPAPSAGQSTASSDGHASSSAVSTAAGAAGGSAGAETAPSADGTASSRR